MPILLIILAGIILFFTNGWFDQQQTVGAILAIFGVIVLIIQTVFFGAVLSKANNTFNSFR